MPNIEEGGREFIRNLYRAEWVQLIPGARGCAGVRGFPSDISDELSNLPLGIDLLEMEPGAAFPTHTHGGAHILFILKGKGTVTMDGTVYPTEPGDCFYIPGHFAHGVAAIEKHSFLAIGFPHRALNDPLRMDIRDDAYLAQQPLMAKIYTGANEEERKEHLDRFQRELSAPLTTTDGRRKVDG